MGSSDQAGKAALRRTLLAARAAVPPGEAEAAGRRLARRALELPELAAARTVAAYVSVGREPATRELLEELRGRGTAVLLPVLLADGDLDWAEYGGPDTLRAAGRGLLEPAGPRLGPAAVRRAGAVLLPGLAVDGRGMRLGRGGGSYDRVLARLAADPDADGDADAGGAALVVLLYDGEVLGHVPAEPHDRPVTAAVTPSAVHRFPRA
ncbi:5-formyltetrahydrofolate cyclo-ligase [Streptomyces sp. MAR4 CNX-425]|uniref:5-formyltetrahydrofolate cyclo-ligase n=1 Tax=Streptomyces sp. MAR4 CNX-425 TaxID=3406343 RepID=UPI003B50C9AB